MPVPSTTLIASTGTVPPSAARTSSTCAGGVRAEVGLGEHDQRLGLRVGGQREEALQPAQVEVAVERADDEREIDVRGEHLRLAAAVGRRARDPAAARQQRVDDAGLGIGGDPVADRRAGRRRSRPRGQPPRRGAGQRAGGAEQVEPAAVHGGDARGNQVAAARAPRTRRRGAGSSPGRRAAGA